MSARNQYEFKDPRAKELNTYSTQLIKELIIPKLAKDINTTKRYAALRQVYYSLILSQWFKQKALRTEDRVQRTEKEKNEYINLINSGNLSGLTSKTPWTKDAYYQEYQKSFKDGEYNLKEPVRTPFGQTIRSYFSGGMSFSIDVPSVNFGNPGQVVSSGVTTVIAGNSKIDFVNLAVNNSNVFYAEAEAGGLTRSFNAVTRNTEIKVSSALKEKSIVRQDFLNKASMGLMAVVNKQPVNSIESKIILGAGLAVMFFWSFNTHLNHP